jgi:hypothetical protein
VKDYPSISYFIWNLRDLNRLKRAEAGVENVNYATIMKLVHIAEFIFI